MNILDAIESGKPFKRPIMSNWHTIQMVDDGSSNFGSIHLIAKDWEVKEEKITISLNEFTDMILYAASKNVSYNEVFKMKLEVQNERKI